MELNQKLQNYAELLVDVGLNINEGKRMFINATTDALPLVRKVVEVAYDRSSIVKSVPGDTNLSAWNFLPFK